MQLATGEIVLPLYSDRFLASIMAISSDGGTSWQTSEPLVGYGNIQPSLVETSGGKLVAWMRENGPRKRIRHSVSSDRGRTWSSVTESELPNPGAKVAVTALASGDWVLAYNPLVDGRHSLEPGHLRRRRATLGGRFIFSRRLPRKRARSVIPASSRPPTVRFT